MSQRNPDFKRKVHQNNLLTISSFFPLSISFRDSKVCTPAFKVFFLNEWKKPNQTGFDWQEKFREIPADEIENRKSPKISKCFFFFFHDSKMGSTTHHSILRLRTLFLECYDAALRQSDFSWRKARFAVRTGRAGCSRIELNCQEDSYWPKSSKRNRIRG